LEGAETRKTIKLLFLIEFEMIARAATVLGRKYVARWIYKIEPTSACVKNRSGMEAFLAEPSRQP
jgi:hypothetical protein